MKYTNWPNYQLGIFTFLFLFFTNAFAQAPDGLITNNTDEQIFAHQLDIVIEAKAIEITLELSTRANEEQQARIKHLQVIDQLRSNMLDISASVISGAEKDIRVKRPNFARLRFAKPVAQSDLIISVTSDKQLAEAINIIKKAKDAEIKSYVVIYDDSIGSDDELTTDLTDQLLADIRQQTKETGKTLTPRGFSELEIQTIETGRDRLEKALDGEKIKKWNKSDQNISLIKTTKKISIGIRAS